MHVVHSILHDYMTALLYRQSKVFSFPKKSIQNTNILRLKPLSHWTATVLQQLATDIASGSQGSLETVASDSLFPGMCRHVAQSSRENFEHVQKFYATKFHAKWLKVLAGVLNPSRTCVADLSQFSCNHFGTRHICKIIRLNCESIAT